MTEHDLQYQIHSYLELKRILHFETDVMSGLQYLSHHTNARFGFINHHKKMGYIKGQPDLVVVYGGKVYFVELKTEKGKQSKEQKAFEQKSKENGIDYLIWRSLDDCISFFC